MIWGPRIDGEVSVLVLGKWWNSYLFRFVMLNELGLLQARADLAGLRRVQSSSSS